jgi:hypothetical protein
VPGSFDDNTLRRLLAVVRAHGESC